MSDEAEASPSEEFLRAVAHAPAVEPPTPQPDLVGQPMGRFRVLARLGQGGMGIVYRAKDTVLGREVALKVLPHDVMRDPGRRRRFLKEARLAASITHPNLVAIYDVGDTDERIYLAMELVDGEALREKLSAGVMGTDEVLRIGAGIARGIARAHAAGIVHRDLKPENVMIAADGAVKVLDFGIATTRPGAEGTTPTASGGSESDLGVVVGTPSYMSPEQAKLRDITDRSDCFALGVVLYEMLTGQRPFTGETVFAVVIAIDRDTPVRPDALRPEVPRALADLVMRCLEKSPQDRPTAEAVAIALEKIEAGATETDPAQPPRPFRSRVGPAATAAALVGLVVAAAFAFGRSPTKAAPQSAERSLARIAPEPSVEDHVARGTASAATAPGLAVAASQAPPQTTASALEATAASAVRAGRSRPVVPSAGYPSAEQLGPAPTAPSAVTTARDPLADPI